MYSTLQLGFLNKPFNLDPGKDIHCVLVTDGWTSERELSLVWEFYLLQLCSFQSHYERISLACADYSQACKLYAWQEKDLVPSRPELPKFYPPKQQEPSPQPAGAAATSRPDLRYAVGVSNNGLRETHPSNPSISGRCSLMPTMASAPEKVSTPLTTEPTKSLLPKEQKPILQPAGSIATLERDLRDLIRVRDDDQKEALPSDLLAVASGKHSPVPANVHIPCED